MAKGPARFAGCRKVGESLFHNGTAVQYKAWRHPKNTAVFCHRISTDLLTDLIIEQTLSPSVAGVGFVRASYPDLAWRDVSSLFLLSYGKTSRYLLY